MEMMVVMVETTSMQVYEGCEGKIQLHLHITILLLLLLSDPSTQRVHT